MSFNRLTQKLKFLTMEKNKRFGEDKWNPKF